MAEALYRKYRPQVFEDVVGQDHIERTLKNAISSDKVSHAYLFTGPRGTGKTTTARLLAKALICEKGPTPEPDGTCEDCRLIAEGEHPDVYELDAASRTGVDNVREEIIGRVNYAPTRSRYKVYIIDEVHMLSVQAFNALLKTLEEPPDHVVFVLCTTDPQKVPETIHSRCQRFDFRRIGSEELVSRLGAICEMEGVPFEGDALELVAHRAQGGMRDALTSLEQLIAFSEGSVTMLQAERLLGSLDSSDMAEIITAVGKRDAAACFRWTSEYIETGADLAQFTQDMAEHVRDMYVMSLAGADVALDITDAARRELQAELALFGPDRLSRMLSVLADLMADLKTSTNQRLSFEIALTRMVRPESDLTLDSLAERIEALERGVQASAPAAVASAPVVVPAASAAVPSDPAPASVAESAAVTEQPSAAMAAAPQQADPAAEAAAPLSDLATQDAQRLWESGMAHLKRISEAHRVIFMNAHPAWETPGDVMSITFAEANDFVFGMAQKDEAKAALKEAFAKAGAPQVRFIIRRGEAAPASASTPEPAAGGGPSAGAGPEGSRAEAAPDVAVAAAQEADRVQPAADPSPQPEAIPESEPVPYEDLMDAIPQPEDVPGSDGAPAQDDANGLNDILAGTFGAEVKFTEVD